MTDQLILEGIFDKNIEIEFTEKNMSSDSGLLLFKPIISQLKLTDSIVALLHDPREPILIQHEQKELLEQRLGLMIAGYHDLNDSDNFRKDPILKIFSKKSNSPFDLASTSTIFRFDDRVTLDECKKLVELQVQLYINRNEKKFELELKEKGFISIVINADPTDVETYGEQQLSLFNGYYRETCYLPMVITDGSNGDLICGFLRPGNKHACWCFESILTRIFKLIEAKYADVRYHIRCDSGFQRESLFKFLDDKNSTTYEIALSVNKSLLKMTDDLYCGAEITFDNNVLKLYKEFGYKADSWSRFRKVVAKIEINRHGHDIRFVVTNSETTALMVIEDYHARCNIENRIKELKNYAGGNRLSAGDFKSNFFRFNLSCFVVICFQEFNKKLSGSGFEKSYISSIREKFIKVAGIVKISVRRILLEISENYPYAQYWKLLLPA
jgi:hypothetical protein